MPRISAASDLAQKLFFSTEASAPFWRTSAADLSQPAFLIAATSAVAFFSHFRPSTFEARSFAAALSHFVPRISAASDLAQKLFFSVAASVALAQSPFAQSSFAHASFAHDDERATRPPFFSPHSPPLSIAAAYRASLLDDARICRRAATMTSSFSQQAVPASLLAHSASAAASTASASLMWANVGPTRRPTGQRLVTLPTCVAMAFFSQSASAAKRAASTSHCLTRASTFFWTDESSLPHGASALQPLVGKTRTAKSATATILKQMRRIIAPPRKNERTIFLCNRTKDRPPTPQYERSA